MSTWLMKLTLNQKLALLAFVLGAVALLASPYPGGTVTVDTRALAAAIATGADRVAPKELASWMLEGRADYRVIDLRNEAAFASGHIPSAEHIPAAALADAGLGRTEKLVLVGDDGVGSAQAWLLLKARGYTGATLLSGGFAGWHEQVVSPVLVENPTPEQKAENDRLIAIAAHFGGQARVAGGLTLVAAVAPPSASPVAAPSAIGLSTSPRAPARKKKEGC
jgi:rhodanese-related sulfurtransferase